MGLLYDVEAVLEAQLYNIRRQLYAVKYNNMNLLHSSSTSIRICLQKVSLLPNKQVVGCGPKAWGTEQAFNNEQVLVCEMLRVNTVC